MKFVSRSEWGASYRRGSTSIGSVYGVTAHWEGPRMGGFPHSQCARKVRSIERFHAVNRGWAGIAYSALVCPHGHVYEGRGLRVRTAANGTSDIGGNDHWYAVCYLGGVSDPFTDAAKDGFRDAVRWLRAQGGAGDRVNGHRDHHATQCPGDAIYAWVRSTNFDNPSPNQEDDMTPAQYDKLLEEVINARDWAWHSTQWGKRNGKRIWQQNHRNENKLARILDRMQDEELAGVLADIRADQAELEAALKEGEQ